MTWSDDVVPADPMTWTSSTTGYIGKDSNGTLDITNGSDVSNGLGYIGYGFDSAGLVTVDGPASTWTNSNWLTVGRFGNGTLNITGGGEVNTGFACIGDTSYSIGKVTVDGANSTWTNTSKLYVGKDGSGTLNITGGGAVTVEMDTWVAYDDDSSGTIHFDDGILTTWGLFCASDDLTGTGTINTYGLVSDVDLVFDSTNGSNQTFSINDNPGQNVTVNLTADGFASMGSGYDGIGTMSISDGIVVESSRGFIGYHSGSTGQITVDGSGSTWSNGGDITIGLNGSGTLIVTEGGAISSNGGLIGNESGSTGAVTVSGEGSTWTNGRYGNLSVGYFGSAILNITGGGTVSNSIGDIGCITGSTGTVTVNGVGSTWTNSSNLYVGRYGSGSMNITEGGVVSNDDAFIGTKSSSTGVVAVNGAGSNWTNSNLHIGQNGIGILNITEGGVVSNDDGFIGDESGSTAEVTVDGANSTWANGGSLIVGHHGSGTLNITGGGAVNVANSVWVNYTFPSSGAIHLDNGTLTTGGFNCAADDLSGTGTINAHGIFSDIDLVFDSTHGLNQSFNINGNSGQNIHVNLNVDGSSTLGAGYGGTGSIRISDGIVVESYYGVLGYKLGSVGVATVDGAGSAWINGTLNVGGGAAAQNPPGDHGEGTLNITNGGTVSNFYGFVGIHPGSVGKIIVDGTGSTWITVHDLYVGGGPFDDGGSGTLIITGGGEVLASDGLIPGSASYVGYACDSTGEVTVDGAGSTLTNKASLYVGKEGSGTLSIIGTGMVSVAETLTIDSDADGDSFINMATGGMLALHGKGDGSIVEYLAMVGGTDAIRYWDYSILDWANILGATYGRDYTLSYMTEGDLSGYTVLTVERAMDGDANGDGAVDVSDLGELATNYGAVGGFGWADGDFTGDGFVNVSDLGILATAYGNGYITTMSQSVPEPNIITLLIMGAVGLLVYPRRKRG